MENQTASTIAREYEKTLRGLIGDYCQAKKQNPYEEFPVLAGAIWRYGLLVEMYTVLCVKFKDMFLEG